MAQARDVSRDAGEIEGVGRVVVGVLATLAVWGVVPFLPFLRLLVGPPFVLAVAVALAGRGMRWTRRTAVVSTVVFGVASVVQSVAYLQDAGHGWSVGYTILFAVFSVAATWLAWVGGLIIAARPRAPESTATPLRRSAEATP